MRGQALTICTVSFHSKRYLELNWELTRYLNPSKQITWVVIENTPPGSDDSLGLETDRFHVFSGYEIDLGKWCPASYHHGIALNKALGLVNTRFLLVLDPDFYIVKQNWMTEVIQYMQANDLASFGAPWHPKWLRKHRYFPCVHCIFIDLAQIDIDTLDFTPGQDDRGEDESILANGRDFRKRSSFPTLKRRITTFVHHLARLGLGVIYNDLQNRKGIGSQQDTGYHLYQQFGHSDQFRSECVIPVYRPDAEGPVQSTRFVSKLLDRLLPDHLSYLPKQPGYYTQVTFRELGYADLRIYGCEEFMWQNAPFGFHLRHYRRGNRNTDHENVALLRAIESLTGMKASYESRSSKSF